MRINVYREEITDDVKVVKIYTDTGKTYYGVRMFLESSDKLHFNGHDDDRSAVTLWIGSYHKAVALAVILRDSLSINTEQE